MMVRINSCTNARDDDSNSEKNLEEEKMLTPFEVKDPPSDEILLHHMKGHQIQGPKCCMVLSTLLCIFGFNPLGLLAFIESKKMKNAMENNDTRTAYVHSRNARALYMSGICIGLIIYVMGIVALIVVFGVLPTSLQTDEPDLYPDE